MLDAHEGDTRAGNEVNRGIYSPDEQQIFRSFLTTLADLDLDYECERERLSRSVKDTKLRGPMLRELAERHRERREPYIRYLQARMMPA